MVFMLNPTFLLQGVRDHIFLDALFCEVGGHLSLAAFLLQPSKVPLTNNWYDTGFEPEQLHCRIVL